MEEKKEEDPSISLPLSPSLPARAEEFQEAEKKQKGNFARSADAITRPMAKKERKEGRKEGRKGAGAGNSIDDNRKEQWCGSSWKSWTVPGADRQGKGRRVAATADPWKRGARSLNVDDRSRARARSPRRVFAPLDVDATSEFISFDFRFVRPRRAVRRERAAYLAFYTHRGTN